MSPRWEQLREGEPLFSVTVVPSAGGARGWAAITGATPDLFVEDEPARERGYPGAVSPGSLRLALAGGVIEDWLGGAGYLKQLRGALRRPDITGQPLRLEATVARCYEEAGRRLADVDFVLVQETGETSVSAVATVEFFAPVL